jgi:hypothetical protein
MTIKKLTYYALKWREQTDYQKRHFGEYWTDNHGIPMLFRYRGVATTFRDHNFSTKGHRKYLVSVKVVLEEVR